MFILNLKNKYPKDIYLDIYNIYNKYSYKYIWIVFI